MSLLVWFNFFRKLLDSFSTTRESMSVVETEIRLLESTEGVQNKRWGGGEDSRQVNFTLLIISDRGPVKSWPNVSD